MTRMQKMVICYLGIYVQRLGLGSEFSSKLQLPKMPGKFQHDQFCVDKFDNFMLTNFVTFFPFSANKIYQLFGDG